MPLSFVGASRLLVASLMIAADSAGLQTLWDASPTRQQSRAAFVQGPTDLLQRHLRIFPPAGDPSGSPRSPAPAGSGSGAAAGRYTAGPRSASGPPPAWRR